MPVEATQSQHLRMEGGHERPRLSGRIRILLKVLTQCRLLCMPVQGLLQSNVIEPACIWQRADEGNKVSEIGNDIPKDRDLSINDFVDIIGHDFKVDDTAFACSSSGSSFWCEG